MSTKSFIGINRLWYGEAIAAITSAEKGLTKEEVLAKIAHASTKEIMNVHQDTWGYEESDPTVSEYINQLTGTPYFRSVDQMGVPTISFTLGEYQYEDKEALQGGKAIKLENESEASSWERSGEVKSIEKCIIAQSKSGDIIVMPRASIVGKGNFVEKNIGLGISAVPVDTGVQGLASEKWFRGITDAELNAPVAP